MKAVCVLESIPCRLGVSWDRLYGRPQGKIGEQPNLGASRSFH